MAAGRVLRRVDRLWGALTGVEGVAGMLAWGALAWVRDRGE